MTPEEEIIRQRNRERSPDLTRVVDLIREYFGEVKVVKLGFHECIDRTVNKIQQCTISIFTEL